PTLNLYLYDLRENLKLRREASQREIERRPSSVITLRPAIRMDLNYLVTAWASDSGDEHRLLARTLLALLRFQELPDDILPESLQDQPNPIAIKVSQPDTLDKPSDLWSVLDNQQRPGIVLTATMAFNPFSPVETPLTRSAQVGFGQKNAAAEGSRGYVSIAGIVKSKKPLANVRITLLERNSLADMQPSGEWGIRNLLPGDYTLEVTADGLKPSQHKIKVPSASYDIEL
ncbi:MAG TPA: Pvc16 family protein, partial [Chloroflexia bacterium]|nr:Pvc16 family protein [Chloroflexia bacterium]